MPKLPIALGMIAFALAATTPTLAAGPTTKGQMASLAKCKAATRKSAKCAAMIKAHPDMTMHSDGAMMAPEGGMMSAEKPGAKRRTKLRRTCRSGGVR